MRVTFLCAVLLAGCASGAAMQADCESRFDKFPDIFRCTRDSIAAKNPGIMKDARAKLYMLRGEQLALEVNEGRLSTLDAKVEWQRLFVELRNQNEQEALAAIAAMPKPVLLIPRAPTTCLSQKLGNSVSTTCN